LVLKRHAVAAMLACALTGCTAAPHRAATPQSPAPRFTETPRYVAPVQTGWMHGVGVDVPAAWPRNQLRCGDPWRTTLVVQSAGAAVPLCAWLTPENFHPDVVWVGSYVAPLQPGAVLGPVEAPARGLGAMTAITIDGEPAREVSTRDRRTHEPAVLVVLPKQAVFVSVSSVHQKIRADAVASIRVVTTDPATGCATRTSAYDRAPRHPILDRPIDVSAAVAAVACHYVAGWLETTAASISPVQRRALVRAVDRAPQVTTARAPIDRGCETVDRGPRQYSDDGPVVLRFRLRDGTTKVVVARVEWCTRWQSYLYAGNVVRRMTGAVLLALPAGVLDQFPGPTTM
jgi:hypothetical protein